MSTWLLLYAHVQVIAVDSFQHIYDFGPFHGINELGKMARFIDDIFNDQLHHRFHHGNPLASVCRGPLRVPPFFFEEERRGKE
jgi:hypothetical protein